MDTHVGVLGGQRKKSASLLYLFLPYSLETRSLLDPETKPVMVTHKLQ